MLDTATLTPSEPGWTGAPFNQLFTLQDDDCNTTDDPNATGNWATFSKPPGTSSATFTVTAKNASAASATPATCTADFTDGVGQTVTMDISVTLSGVGVNLR